MSGDLAIVSGKSLACFTPRRVEAMVDTAISAVLGSPLDVKTESRFTEDGPFKGEVFIGITRPRGITAGQINSIEKIICCYMQPQPRAETVAQLGVLDSITAKKGEDLSDLELRIEVLAAKLGDYPADAVHVVLDRPRHWFPTWGILYDELEAEVSRRRHILRTVQSWKPWSDDDERDYLAGRLKDAKFYAKHYWHRDPVRAAAEAKQAVAIEAALAKLDRA